MNIRKEETKDIKTISELTAAAFEPIQISNNTEPYIIQALRKAEALTISLVAEMDGRVVGHIAFSPVEISDGSKGWYGLGPVSVTPDLQKQGIGKSLINEGLSLLKAQSAKGCMLVGDPGYYQRFGFKNHPDLIHEGIPQEVFLILLFIDPLPKGTVQFHNGFRATE